MLYHGIYGNILQIIQIQDRRTNLSPHKILQTYSKLCIYYLLCIYHEINLQLSLFLHFRVTVLRDKLIYFISVKIFIILTTSLQKIPSLQKILIQIQSLSLCIMKSFQNHHSFIYNLLEKLLLK